MDEIINEYNEITNEQFSTLDKKIYDTLIDHFAGNLDMSDGKIRYTAKNIKAAGSIYSTLLNQTSGILTKIGLTIIEGLEKIFRATSKNLSKQSPDITKHSGKIISRLNDHAATSLRENLTLKTIFEELKKDTLVMMSKPDGISLKDLRKSMQTKIVDKEITKRYFSRWTGDIYSQYQRAAANEIRKKVGLRYAIYQGGLIETSRPFCESRNGKVFSEKDISKWSELNFTGKPETGYDPFIDCGGYNCRHRLDWISDQLAETMLKKENKSLPESKTFPSDDYFAKPVFDLNTPPAKAVNKIMEQKNFMQNLFIHEGYYGGGKSAQNYLAKEMKYNDVPNKINLTEAENLYDSHHVLFRGMTVSKYEYLTEERYGGLGVYGDGDYFSTWKETAESFANHSDKNVMKVLFPKNAKILNYEDIDYKHTGELFREIENMPPALFKQMVKNALNLDDDQEIDEDKLFKFKARLMASVDEAGTYATFMGYDAIRKKFGSKADAEEYFVILNRSKVKFIFDYEHKKTTN